MLDARTELGALLDEVSGLRLLVTSRVPLRIPGEREFRRLSDIRPLESAGRLRR